MVNEFSARKRFFGHAGGLLLLLLTLNGCHPAAPPAPPAQPPPQVTVGHPLAKEIVDYDEFTARLGAVDSVEIRARVSGYLQKVNFKDGVEVKKGDLLFVIDPRPYQAELDSAQAALERARTQLDLATNDNKRALELYQSKAISAEELDTRSKNLQGAFAAVKIADALVETAKLNLEYTNITAPIDGRVGRAMVTEGNLVNANGNESTLLTTLVSVDPVYAYFDVDEATVIKYQNLDKEGLRQNGHRGPIPCELAIGNEAAFAHQGTVDFVDNQINSGTGTLNARGVFPNPDRTLIPGEFGRVRVSRSGKYTGLLVPDYAIDSDQDKKLVYVVGADQTVQPRPVVPGQLVDGLRVIRSGLDANDLVVLDRLQIIRPGETVSPKEEPIQPAAEATADPAHP
ncbi:MAG TPA: efflux RND transporter periplasmic adaptor subunit [Candidatus Methylacidiphilales bacterium]|jgi:multidrug efflux system membrane fusion protein|nr:efflux RND transporter periplasmic adaptor subunit [Candidatus Methylacidiphilales bacterium]